ncbi:MAG: DMT family transporter [Microcystaceae cyanobacterium]
MIPLHFLSNFKGELAALGAAFLWAVSSVVYQLLGQRIPPLLLNLLKGLIAIAFLAITLLLTDRTLPELNPIPVGLLLLSGVIGIGLGDTAYFITLNHLGARRTLLMETLAPPITAILALVFLRESLSASAWCGIFLILIGIVWVITEQTSTAVVNSPHPRRGIIWGLLAALAQASGAVLSRSALIISPLTPLWSTLLRLLAGSAIVLVLLLVSDRHQNKPSQVFQRLELRRLLGAIALTAFGSTYLRSVR